MEVKASNGSIIKTGDIVLVRNNDEHIWIISIFGYIFDNNRFYSCINGDVFKQCIPFNGNEHLVGRIESYKDTLKESCSKQEKEPLSNEDITHIEHTLSLITPGVWTLYYEQHEGPKVYGIHNGSYSNGGTFEEIIPAEVTEDSYSCDGREYGILNPDDALFIVKSPEYVKKLISEVKYLKNRLSAIDNKQ